MRHRKTSINFLAISKIIDIETLHQSGLSINYMDFSQFIDISVLRHRKTSINFPAIPNKNRDRGVVSRMGLVSTIMNYYK